MDFLNLDDVIRQTMLDELERDVATGTVYLAARLSERGRAQWPALLADALRHGTPGTLADALRAGGLLLDTQTAHRGGVPYQRKVPPSAATTLADGEFNRYYIRAVCAHAIEAGAKVQVYRARIVASPRPESQAMIGQLLDPVPLLDDLRGGVGSGTSAGLARPNSGLSIRLA